MCLTTTDPWFLSLHVATRELHNAAQITPNLSTDLTNQHTFQIMHSQPLFLNSEAYIPPLMKLCSGILVFQLLSFHLGTHFPLPMN